MGKKHGFLGERGTNPKAQRKRSERQARFERDLHNHPEKYLTSGAGRATTAILVSMFGTAAAASSACCRTVDGDRVSEIFVGRIDSSQRNCVVRAMKHYVYVGENEACEEFVRAIENGTLTPASIEPRNCADGVPESVENYDIYVSKHDHSARRVNDLESRLCGCYMADRTNYRLVAEVFGAMFAVTAILVTLIGYRESIGNWFSRHLRGRSEERTHLLAAEEAPRRPEVSPV